MLFLIRRYCIDKSIFKEFTVHDMPIADEMELIDLLDYIKKRKVP
jgi:succinate dehydrogenase/fumarate reductase-like Fe-S protein